MRKIKRCLMLLSLSAIFLIVLKTELLDYALGIFIWALIVFYLINLWIYEKSKKNLYLIIPITVFIILADLAIISFISWLFGINIFSGKLSTIFAWPSFIASLFTFFYLALIEIRINSKSKKNETSRNYEK